MFIVLFLTALQFSSAFGATLSEVYSAYSQKMVTKQMVQVPKKTSGQFMGSAGTNPQNIYIYQYQNQDCLGDARFVNGNIFNVCLTGLDKNGKAVGSGVYQIVESQDPYTYTYYREFASSDCTGAVSYEEEQNYGNMCFVPSDTTFSKTIRGTFSNLTDPSTILERGVIFNYFDNADRCKAGTMPASFTYVRFGECFPTDDGSVVYSGCADGKVNVIVYNDSKCSDVSVTGGIDIATCNRYQSSPASDNDYHYANFVSYVCV